MIKEKIGEGAYVHLTDVNKKWVDPVNIYTIGNVKIMFGTVQVKTTTASASSATFPYYGYTYVAFPEAFSSVPSIACNIPHHYGWWNAEVSAVDKNGFNARVAGDVNNETSDYWFLAIGGA